MTSINISHLWHKNRSTHFLIGLCCSLSVVVVTFQYTIPRTVYDSFLQEASLENFYMEINHHVTKEYSASETPKAVNIRHPDPVIKEVTTEIPQSPMEDVTKHVADYSSTGTTPEPLGLPTTPKFVTPISVKTTSSDEKIHNVVDEMPYLAECSYILDPEKRYACSREKLYTFIKERLKYPNEAKSNKIEGKVLASFVVDETGMITNIEILREPHRTMGKEVERVLRTDLKWQPGKMYGKVVKVRYRIPIEFSLMD